MKPWYMQTVRVLGWRDRLRVLIGRPIRVRFDSPDGDCHAACNITIATDGFRCHLRGHRYGPPMWSNERVFLRCVECGEESTGVRIEGAL